ncbi:Helix-turn-helix domain protein [Rosistilla ulvae]|uniref:Helix-turn-helix domain protein n=1 Tax=Rosistilla ulvae TaxID=1930277 RepID=A0A517M1I4_9BACT|nr:helix-turn-helix domain-containing protein [Rosistilla ulvae]QDS88740.1 Helix-turn-helix domain protein [Rosistilla ulvae]
MANSPLTPGQLEQLADMIAERVVKQPRCLGKAELAQKLGVSTSTVERLMAEKKIPVIRAARRVLFDIEAVLAALSTNNEE